MADERAKSLEDFSASFKGFMDQMAAQAPAEEPAFLKLLRAHFGRRACGLTSSPSSSRPRSTPTSRRRSIPTSPSGTARANWSASPASNPMPRPWLA